MNFNILKKELDSIKMARKSGKSLRSLQPIVTNLYKKINMSGGENNKPKNFHTRKNKSVIYHYFDQRNETAPYEYAKRTEELVKMYNEVLNIFRQIPVTQDYDYILKYILKIAGEDYMEYIREEKKDYDENLNLLSQSVEDILNKISRVYLNITNDIKTERKVKKLKNNSLLSFYTVSFVKTTTPNKPKPYKWDLENRPEKLIPFSIAYGATRILENFEDFNLYKDICLEMLLNSLAPEVEERNQSYPVTLSNGSVKINRKKTISLYEKEITNSGKFTFTLYNKQGRIIDTLVIEDPIIEATVRSNSTVNSNSNSNSNSSERSKPTARSKPRARSKSPERSNKPKPKPTKRSKPTARSKPKPKPKPSVSSKRKSKYNEREAKTNLYSAFRNNSNSNSNSNSNNNSNSNSNNKNNK